MESKQLKNIVVLLGPKAVGKTLVASKLASKFDGYSIFSSDKLENFAMIFTRGNFRSLDEIKSAVEKEFSDENALKKYSGDPDEIVRKNREYVKEYMDSIDYYSQRVDFRKMRQIVYETTKIMSSHEFSVKQLLFIMQYQKFKMVKEALSNIKEPLICDFGADMGALLELSKNECKELSIVFNKPFQELRKEQNDFFDMFETVVYLQPGIDYKEKVDPRSSDEHNKLYSENINSYLSFADIVVTMNGTFNDPGNLIFMNDNDFDSGAFAKKESLMNKSNVENICELIASEVEQFKQYSQMQ